MSNEIDKKIRKPLEQRVNHSTFPVLFRHVQVGNGWATIAARRKTQETETLWRVAVAWCSPLDQFSRQRGRDISSRAVRHVSYPSFLIAVQAEEGETESHFRQRMFRLALANAPRPTWAEGVIEGWEPVKAPLVVKASRLLDLPITP